MAPAKQIKTTGIILILVSVFAFGNLVFAAAEETADPKFNPNLSTDQVENRMVLDHEANPLYESRLLRPIGDWRDGLAEPYGLKWSLDYSAQFMALSDSLDADRASGGMVRFFGSWDLVGRGTANTGSLLWKVEHRHAYTDVSVSGLGLQSGYVGLFEPPFNDQGARMTLLNWKQAFNEGRGTFIAGFIDVTDYVDVYLLASPWTGFNNFVFSTGSAAMDLPNESAFGGGAGHMISDTFYLQAGLVDANSDPTEPFESFSTFFDLRDTYKWVELGWTPGQDKIYFDNAHVTVWQIDERANGTPSGWGFNLSYQRWIDDKWLPFARFGYADDSGSLLERSVSIGLGYQPVPMRGVIGFGLNWGQPNEASFGDLDAQFTAEAYWRYQLTKELAVTPSLQYIRNPALNTDAGSMWAIGLRFRFAL